jgi:ADP-heptose:LPS heptosyltransferase
MPKHTQPRWTGQSVEGKTILVVGEQGHGDNIQFVRFLFNLHKMGARVKFMVTDALIPLLKGSEIFELVCGYTDDPGSFDYWISLMSVPAVFGVTLENLGRPVHYLTVSKDIEQEWLQIQGPKTRMRVGFCWSGRKDNWLNEHKGMPFEEITKLIAANPQHDWINLQVDAAPEEQAELEKLGVKLFPGSIQNFSDTAGLIMTMDVVISVDTAVAHLAGALGRPTWIMLNWFATDWRWLVNRDDCPWYSTARLFRQPKQDDWTSVTKKISQYLSWFKV